MRVLRVLWCCLRLLLVARSRLVLENLALRQQLAVLSRQRPRPPLHRRDRLFWVCLAQVYASWRSALVVVQPDTVVRWHQQAFRLWWRWKSKTRRPGRPRLVKEVRDLIARMAGENPTWGVPRIQSELRLLGHEVAQSTIAKYVRRPSKPPSQTWRTFLTNHAGQIAAIDFFTVPTATFRLLYVFIVLAHDRRQVLHFQVTDHPTAVWTARQLAAAFPYERAPRFLLRDRDGIYGEVFRHKVRSLGIEEMVTAPRSPWQNPYVERVIGSIRRELLDHVIVLNERHLHRLLASYFAYYHQARAHLSLERNAPVPREVELPEKGRVIAIPQVGGLHHRYRRCA